ncbi:MAG: S8 family serine peptidase [Panacagrimonas sp.]
MAFLLMTSVLTASAAVPIAKKARATEGGGQAKSQAQHRLQGGLARIAQQKAVQAKQLPSNPDIGPDRLRLFEDESGAWIGLDLVATTDPGTLVARLTNLGARNIAVFGRQVSAQILLGRLDQLSSEPSLLLARPVRASTRLGPVLSQGDAAIRGSAGRSLLLAGKPTGAGVKVGVLSDSFNCLGGAAADQGNNEFPPVTVLRELSGCAGGADEGRAMVQILADVAPGAQPLFRTAFEGAADFAQGIGELVSAGADVIVDDIGYYDQPFFQDGIIAQAADAAVSAGVPFISASGNDGRKSYESVFQATVAPRIDVDATGIGHDFDPGPGVDYAQAVTLGAGKRLDIILQWDDPFASAHPGSPGTSRDLDIHLLDAAGNVLASGNDFNIGRDPIENLQFTNFGAQANFNLRIEIYAGGPPGRIKYLNVGDAPVALEFDTRSPTSFAHSVAAQVFGVGAAFYRDTPSCGVNPPRLESFSSGGGTPILLAPDGSRLAAAEIRNKPDAVGPDGVNTSFFGSDIGNKGGSTACQDADTSPNFFGSSAAAPHVAGVVALMLQANPAATPSQLYAALRNTALDMETAGFDFLSGRGLVRADNAIKAILPTLTVSRSSQTLGEGGAAGYFDVRLSAASGRKVTVNLKIGGSAKNGVDYKSVAVAVTIPAGARSRRIWVQALADTLAETGEKATFTLSGAVGAKIGQQSTYTASFTDPT